MVMTSWLNLINSNKTIVVDLLSVNFEEGKKF